MSDVFISHVEEDAEIALEITLGLEEIINGIRMFGSAINPVDKA